MMKRERPRDIVLLVSEARTLPSRLPYWVQLQLSYLLLLLVYSIAWPLHDIAAANVVCMVYGIHKQGGRVGVVYFAIVVR